VASFLADALPRRAATISAQSIRVARELERVRRRLAELRSVGA
jgi:hypothetical protein